VEDNIIIDEEEGKSSTDRYIASKIRTTKLKGSLIINNSTSSKNAKQSPIFLSKGRPPKRLQSPPPLVNQQIDKPFETIPSLKASLRKSLPATEPLIVVSSGREKKTVTDLIGNLVVGQRQVRGDTSGSRDKLLLSI